MTKHVTTEREFIFRERQDGQLEFIGDFNGLYGTHEDPWAQSGNNLGWQQAYYDFSLGKIITAMNKITSKNNVLEIGCGIGFVVDFLAKNLPGSTINGMDISSVAIARAHNKFPAYHFTIGDVGSKKLNVQKKYNIIIFNQLLWYILKDLKNEISNAHHLLTFGGSLLVSQSFLRNKQRYGGDIVEGCNGFLNFMATHHSDIFSMENMQYDQSDIYHHHDGLLVYKKIDV